MSADFDCIHNQLIILDVGFALDECTNNLLNGDALGVLNCLRL